MGRQPFLTRLAFGRSPFEPSTSVTKSSEYLQIDSSQHDVSLGTCDTTLNRYVQLYDERGIAINPRAREHGRRFRKAKNDVLSAIGVVERHRSPSDGLPGAYQERLEQLENEDSAGNALALASTLTENICTWWIGSLRDRILTFRLHNAIPFSQVIASVQPLSRTQLIYTGFAARLLSTISVQFSVYAAFVFRPLDRFLVLTHAAPKTRYLARRWKGLTRASFRLLVEVLFYPFAYHSHLQRLGLIAPRPYFPAWRAFLPFSASSPIRPISLAADTPLAALIKLFDASVSSPLAFVCLEHILERWIYAVIYEAVETSITRPDNPDLPSSESLAKQKANNFLGLRLKSPRLVRNAVNRILVILGWGEPYRPEQPESRRSGGDRVANTDAERNIDTSHTQVTEINRISIPAVSNSRVHTGAVEEQSVPLLPVSPTVSDANDDANDPTIRITSREGIVEMEVEFPVHVSSTEVSEPNSSYQRGFTTPSLPRGAQGQAYHRVTQLSIEPAQMLGAVCKSLLVGWALMPLKLVTLRLIASHHLVGTARTNGPLLGHDLVIFPVNMTDVDLRSIAVLVSRVAICGALELAVDLSLWGLQWMAVTHMGKTYFGWGTL